jgi:hypothetical protein
MSTTQVAAMAAARLTKPSGPCPLPSADHAGVNCRINAVPEASFTSGWYRPGRPMSQSERLPS